jgi:hypothetical protein
MKRSEALKIIDDTYGKFCADWLQVNLDNLEQFIPLNERILNALEHAGMVSRYPNSYGFLDEDNEVIMNDGWEPEDEKK